MTNPEARRVKLPGQLWLEQVCPYVPDGPVVYIMFGVDRTVYYVGQSDKAGRRLTEHGREPAKRNLVTRVVIIPVATREAMMTAQRELIETLNPKWNPGRA